MNYAILDIEATGGKRSQESIIEIAIFIFDGKKIIDQFSSLVNPKKAILPYVEKLTGINQKLLENAPIFSKIAPFILDLTKDCILIGHGIEFDYYILRLEFSRLNISFERKLLDTLTLSKKYFPKESSYSLGKLSHSFGIPIANRHRALGDAQATLELFKHLLKKME